MTVVYESLTILLEETPCGCFITDKQKGVTLQVGHKEDIHAIIDSLERLDLLWYVEED